MAFWLTNAANPIWNSFADCVAGTDAASSSGVVRRPPSGERFNCRIEPHHNLSTSLWTLRCCQSATALGPKRCARLLLKRKTARAIDRRRSSGFNGCCAHSLSLTLEHSLRDHLTSSTSTTSSVRSDSSRDDVWQQWRSPAKTRSATASAAGGAAARALGERFDRTISSNTLDQAHERIEQSFEITESPIITHTD